MFKCPYCSQDSYAKSSKKKGKFESWESVKIHIGKCKFNNKTYFIDKNNGPIHLSEIYQVSDIEFSRKFPLANASIRNIKKAFNVKNIDTGNHSKLKVEDLLLQIQLFVEKYNKIPTALDFEYSTSEHASRCSFSNHFGSWNEAIKAAGFEPNIQSNYGIKTIAKDNVLYRSQAEAYFVDNFLYRRYNYEYERKYDNHNKYYDFYLPELNIYIELDGELRPEVIKEKIAINKQENKNLIVIKTKDIYNKKELKDFPGIMVNG